MIKKNCELIILSIHLSFEIISYFIYDELFFWVVIIFIFYELTELLIKFMNVSISYLKNNIFYYLILLIISDVFWKINL